MPPGGPEMMIASRNLLIMPLGIPSKGDFCAVPERHYDPGRTENENKANTHRDSAQGLRPARSMIP